MPLDVFAPVLNPSTTSTRAVRARVNSAQFGDGYSQRSMDGLNTTPRTYNANWTGMASTDADTIEAFFAAHTVTPFLWQPPLDTVQRKWIAGNWSRGYPGGDSASLTATFVEVFDL